MCGAQFNHFTGADKKHVALVKSAEEPHRKPYGSRSKAHGTRADGSRGAHLLGNRERLLKEVVEHQAEPAATACFSNGFLELPHDLGFAKHHRIDPGDHPIDVARGFGSAKLIGVRLKVRGRDGLDLFNESTQGFPGNRSVLTGAVDLGAVAGRQNHGFMDAAAGCVAQTGLDQFNSRGDLFGAEGDALEH